MPDVWDGLGKFNGMSFQSHLLHCRVLPPGEFTVIIPELCVTSQGAASGRIQCHVIPEPRITLQGAATWWIQCHDSRATCHIAGCSHLTKSMSWSCHIAGCKNSICHIENRFLPYFIFFFLMQFRLWRAAAFVSSPIHLYCYAIPSAESMMLTWLSYQRCVTVFCHSHVYIIQVKVLLRLKLKLIVMISLNIHMMTRQDRMCVQCMTNGLHWEAVWLITAIDTLEKTCIHVVDVRNVF